MNTLLCGDDDEIHDDSCRSQAEHSAHAEAPGLENCPNGHGSHADDPGDALKLPAAHC
jgi:hypothetical protein